MKFNNVCDYYDVITEESRQDVKVNYNIDITVNDGKFKAKGEGNIRIPREISANIVCIEDVINYIVSNESKVKTVNKSEVDSKTILSQMLFAFMDKESAKYLTAKDHINFSFDYGTSDNNCIGIMVIKQIGSPMFSMIMRMNQTALPNEFNKNAIDARILSYASVNSTNN